MKREHRPRAELRRRELDRITRTPSPADNLAMSAARATFRAERSIVARDHAAARLGEDHPDTFRCFNNLANLLSTWRLRAPSALPQLVDKLQLKFGPMIIHARRRRQPCESPAGKGTTRRRCISAVTTRTR